MLFAVTFFAYAYFYQAGGWNQNSRFDLVRAWVEEGRTAIDSYHANTKDKAKRLGHFYCDKAPGVSWLAIPVHAAVRAVHPEEPPGPRLLALSSWLAAVFVVGLPSALAVVFLDLLLAAWGLAPRPRAALALAYGLATLTWPYSTLLYGHQLAAALLLIGFTLLARPRSPGAGALFTAGFLFGLAVVAEYPAALAVLPLAAYAAVTIRPRTRVLWLILGGLLPAVVLALYHWQIFGSPLALPYDFSTRKHRHLGFFMGLGVPRPEAFWHLLLSPFRGLLFSAPWLALAIPGAVRLWRLRRRAEVLTAAAVSLLFVWMNTSLVDWDGGWATGPRYLIPAIPFLVLLVAGLFPRNGASPGRAPGWATRGFGALAVLSAGLMLAATAVKPEVPNTFRAPFTEWILPEFFAGRLAGNTQSIDSLWPVEGGPAAAWNLGQLLGLSGLASLLPLALAILGGSVWLLRPPAAGRPAEKTSARLTLD